MNWNSSPTKIISRQDQGHGWIQGFCKRTCPLFNRALLLWILWLLFLRFHRSQVVGAQDYCCVFVQEAPNQAERGGCLCLSGHRYLTSLFPHSSECATTHEYRRNQTFSKSNGGQGWIKESFPIDEIFRDVFSAVTERLSGVPKNGEHFGMFFKYSLTVILFDRSSKKT